MEGTTESGAVLRVAMAVRGISGRELSRRTGIHTSRLSRLLNGRETLTPETRRRIERAVFADLMEDAAVEPVRTARCAR